MERITRGDVWIVEPAGHPKPRPAIVVSIDPINDLCPDVLLVPVTTKPGPLRVEVSERAEISGLKTRSFAECESVGPVHKARLKKKIGCVLPPSIASIEEGLRTVLGLAP